MARTPRKSAKAVAALTHGGAKRRNAPTAEAQPFMADEDRAPVRVALERRNRDLDPQLVWRGKDEQDAAGLVVQAAPLFIQEKVHPKALIDDLLREARRRRDEAAEAAPDLFADFNGLPEGADRTEFYAHDANWSNRMILGDALQVMGSLAEREGLRGKVQCIYIDPPYGIRFNSNFQWSTTSRDVKDGKAEHVTREPEQVKAFRDTWRDGIHSYLAYLRDRLTAARDLLAESGSVFVQIGDENVHRVRSVMDEVFGEENFVREIFFTKTGSLTSNFIGRTGDRILWYAKAIDACKFRPIFEDKLHDKFYKNVEIEPFTYRLISSQEIMLPPSGIEGRIFQFTSLESAGQAKIDTPIRFHGKIYRPTKNSHWKVTYPDGMKRLSMSGRISVQGNKLRYRLYIDDYPIKRIGDVWVDTSGFAADQLYVVETRPKVIERCLLMTTDPGDLVLDPTCGSGTTAYVAEQWGRRWITIDTSRVALALARARIMGARYPWYLLADSPQGQRKEAELTGRAPAETPTGGDVRQGFVYERVPHVTLKSIANNAEIDAIWEKWRETLEPLRSQLSVACGRWSVVSGEDDRPLEEWEIPRERPADWPPEADAPLAEFWESRIARQREIDASIVARADTEYLYDKPYADPSRVRVAGPFTVESLAPHRILGVGPDDELLDGLRDGAAGRDGRADFAAMVLEHLEVSGVQQAHREDRIAFSSIAPWPGEHVCAEGRYGGLDDGPDRRAGIFVGPEFGTVQRSDLVAAAREAAEAGFDALVACAFNYEAHASDFARLGRIAVFKARMNADLHMAGDLKNTGKGNLFVVFGEPDIEIEEAENDRIRVRIRGVDVFHPNSGEVRSDGPDGIACWFVDTDYDEESFFVRHAYFLGANDPYRALKTTLKAEIDPDAWATLNSDTSRPFDRPSSGRIAVKVINHLGDEAMKVFRV